VTPIGDNRSVTDGMRKAMDGGRERAQAAREAAAEKVEATRGAAVERMEATAERMEVAREAAGDRMDAAREATAERVEAARMAAAKVKPKLRGVIHEYAFPISVLAGALLVAFAADGRARLALGIYAISLSALLGTSALYHRVNWQRPGARRWMRRLDHSMIFLLIAGTFTPFAVLVLDGPLADAVLIAVWAGAAAGVIIELIWVDAPKWVSAIVYVAVGSIGAFAIPAIVVEAGIGAGLLIAAGGAMYTAGAVIYALGRPDPSPTVFGYHEIFHVLVVAAAASHFAAIAIYAGSAG
jgi:hemolysin III